MNYYSISEVKQVEAPKHDLLPIIGKRKEKLPEFTRDQVKMLHYLLNIKVQCSSDCQVLFLRNRAVHL